MPRHFAFVAPTAVPRAPQGLVAPPRVTVTASATRPTLRLSRRSQSSLHLDWIRDGERAPVVPSPPAAGGAAAGPSAAERWAEELRAPRATAPVADAAAAAAPAKPAGPSAAERWVEQMAAQHASVAASAKSKKTTKPASAELTQAQRSYYARMDRFTSNHLSSDGAAPAGAVNTSANTGAGSAKPKVAASSSYVPAFNSAHVPSYAARNPAFYVPSFKSYASLTPKPSAAVASASTDAVNMWAIETSDAASTLAEDGVVSPPKLNQALNAARMARLARRARRTAVAPLAVSETSATKGNPVPSEAQMRWSRLADHARATNKVAETESAVKKVGADSGIASNEGAAGDRVVEKVSSADLEVHAKTARERVADAELARELAMRRIQVKDGSGSSSDARQRGKQLVGGGSGFATFAAANGAAAMSPMSIAAMAGAGGASNMSEEDALANAQQTFVSSTVVTLFLAMCLVCGDRFGDLVQYATGQGMFM